MSRSFLALAVFLAVLATVGTLPAAAVGAADTGPTEAALPVVDVPNTTSRLELGEPVERTGFTTADIDVGASLAADNVVIHSRYARHRLDQRYRTAENDSARRRVLRNAADRLDERISDLRDRERRALAAYTAGEISTATYLRRLTVIDTESNRLSAAVTRLDNRVAAADGQPVSKTRMAEFNARLVPLRGPVRDHARDSLSGAVEPTRVYVETSSEGVVAAMLTDMDHEAPRSPEYVREAYVADARNSTAGDRFDDGGSQAFDAAVSRAEELYPWTFANHEGYSLGRFGSEPYLHQASVYAIGVNHPHGTNRRFDLVTYLDGGTTDVFREVQYLSPERLPLHSVGQNRTARLTLEVNATRPGAPARVNVTDIVGAAAPSTIYVDGERVGRTGDDGELWFVAPRGQFNVTATHDDARVIVTGDATP